MARERWKIETAIWELDEQGRGLVAYRIETAERPLHYVIYSDNLPDDQKSERIVGQRYDGVGYVGQGEIERDRVERLRKESENFVLGRADNTVVGFTRMNRSTSAFNSSPPSQ